MDIADKTVSARVNPQIAKWDTRHAARRTSPLEPPSDWLASVTGALPLGRALDLACGTGRNALMLADRGWHVRAVDGSAIALERVTDEAAQRGIADRIETVRVDLENADEIPGAFAGEGFDLVVVTHFLHRPLFDHVRAAVRVGGCFAAEIAILGSGRAHSMNPAYTLAQGELRRLIDGWGWTVTAYDEGADDVARTIARRNP